MKGPQESVPHFPSLCGVYAPQGIVVGPWSHLFGVHGDLLPSRAAHGHLKGDQSTVASGFSKKVLMHLGSGERGREGGRTGDEEGCSTSSS